MEIITGITFVSLPVLLVERVLVHEGGQKDLVALHEVEFPRGEGLEDLHSVGEGGHKVRGEEHGEGAAVVGVD